MAALSWKLLRPTTAPVKLVVRPLFFHKSFDRRRRGFRLEPDENGGRLVWQPGGDTPRIVADMNGAYRDDRFQLLNPCAALDACHFGVGLFEFELKSRPAVLILALAAVRIDVKISMGLSSLAGMAIALFIQQVSLAELLGYIATGYRLDQPGPLSDVIQGGGLLSMLQVSLIVLISSAFSGLFAGTGLLRDIELAYELISRKVGIYAGTVVTSFATAAFGCCGSGC
jgi:hypothetical protein